MQFRRIGLTLLLLCVAAIPLAAKPMNPNPISFVGGGLFQDVGALGNRAYVTDGLSLAEYNFRQHGGWSLVSLLDLAGGAGAVALHGSSVYVSSLTPGEGVRILDTANHGLTEIGAYEFTGTAGDLAVPNDLGYVADTANGLVRVFRALGSDLGTEVTTISWPTSALAVQGDLGYFSGPDGLGLFDLSDPLSPTLLGECATPTGAAAVDVKGQWAFLADYDAGLVVVDTETPSGPAVVATVSLPDDALDVAVHGCYAYVAAGLSGLRILDVSHPTAPYEVGFYETVGEATAVTVLGDRIYVVDSGQGLVFLRSAPGFEDVDGTEWAFAQIQACYRADIVTGYPDGTYKPEEPVTRAQMAAFVARGLAGGDAAIPQATVQSFRDVAADSWAYNAIEYLQAQGIVEGFGDGTYQPNATVNRAQMAVYTARTRTRGAAIPEPAGPPSFSDVSPSNWAYSSIEYAKSAGIVQGYDDGTYQPDATVTRDQLAVYIARTFGLPF